MHLWVQSIPYTLPATPECPGPVPTPREVSKADIQAARKFLITGLGVGLAAQGGMPVDHFGSINPQIMALDLAVREAGTTVVGFEAAPSLAGRGDLIRSAWRGMGRAMLEESDSHIGLTVASRVRQFLVDRGVCEDYSQVMRDLALQVADEKVRYRDRHLTPCPYMVKLPHDLDSTPYR